ncbi:MAG: UMP kinase [Haloarculaceae archaeon]
MRVVVSIGGSVLAPDLDAGRVGSYADVVRDLTAAGRELGVVVGGGPVAREYIEAARALDANEIELDQIGIDVTRLNARLLITALGDLAAPSPPADHQTGREVLQRGQVPVMGGTEPAHTTDAVAAAFAEYVNADLLVYATSVPGVFDADPNANPDADRFDRLTASELVTVIAELEMDAGSSAPVDLLAAKIIQRSGMPAVVLDGADPASIERAIGEGAFDGTEIVPDDGVALDARLEFDDD